MRTFSRLILPSLIILCLAACIPGQGIPLGLEGTNIGSELIALQKTQNAINYMASQTPYAATLMAQGTENANEAIAQGTQAQLSAQGTGQALQIQADGATSTQIAASTQGAYAAQGTLRADSLTATAITVGATSTQELVRATQTQAAFEYERKESINKAIAWTPFIVAAGIALLLWRFVLVAENRKSVFYTPSGEAIFTRKPGIMGAIVRVVLRRIWPEISFDDFTMPGRAVGHGLRERPRGYEPTSDTDREAQLRVIANEQLRQYAPPLLPGPRLDYPALPAYTGLSEGVETVAPNSPEIQAWLIDVDNQE